MGRHHHDHHNHGTRAALSWALLLNGSFLVIEAAVGWWTGSLALLSDAAHMLSDVGALVLALAAAQLARKGANMAMTFGLARAEVLGAFLNGLGLLAACGWIAWEAIGRLGAGAPEVAGVPVLVVGIIGLAINLGSAWALYRAGSDNLNVRAALAHMLADAVGSVGAIAAALLMLVGVPAADAVVSLGVGVLVAWGSWSLLRDAGRVLLQLPPRALDVQAVCLGLCALPGVVAVHDVHVWSLDGKHAILSGHVVVDESADAQDVSIAGHALLADRFHLQHATLQVERGAGCGTSCGVRAQGA